MHFAMDKYHMTNTFGFPYDYQSVMHYENYAFSINGRTTMETINPPGVSIPNPAYRSRLSDIDVAEIRTLYKCY